MPADAAPPSKNRTLMLACLIGVILLTLAGWFFWKGTKTKSVPGKSAATNAALAKVARGTGASRQTLKSPQSASKESGKGSNITAVPSPEAGTQGQKTESRSQESGVKNAEKNVAPMDSNGVSGATSSVPVAVSTSTPPVNAASPELATHENEATAAVGESSAPPQTFPPLSLEGIALRRTNPSVIINGQVLYVGDALKRVRVVTIDRQEVTVELEGQRKVLSMP